MVHAMPLSSPKVYLEIEKKPQFDKKGEKYSLIRNVSAGRYMGPKYLSHKSIEARYDFMEMLRNSASTKEWISYYSGSSHRDNSSNVTEDLRERADNEDEYVLELELFEMPSHFKEVLLGNKEAWDETDITETKEEQQEEQSGGWSLRSLAMSFIEANSSFCCSDREHDIIEDEIPIREVFVKQFDLVPTFSSVTAESGIFSKETSSAWWDL